MMKSEDKQISLTDPDARSMATSGKDTGIVGYNVQIAVDTQHHLIVAHEVTNVGTDRHQLANMAEQARDETIDAVADRGYYDSEEIRACEDSGITVTLPKPMTSGAKAAGRFGKRDFERTVAPALIIPAQKQPVPRRRRTQSLIGHGNKVLHGLRCRRRRRRRHQVVLRRWRGGCMCPAAQTEAT
jgi:hypothetical protein